MKVMQRVAATLGSCLLLLGSLVACSGGGSSLSPGVSPGAGDGPQTVAFADGFRAVGSSDSTVSLGWTKLAGASGYTVERKQDNGAWTAVAVLDAQAQHHLDGGLQRNTRYSYRVRADGTSQQAETTADTGEEAVLVRPLGAATGSAVAQPLGAIGGRLVSPDGRISIEVPAGALAADTAVRLQPIANTAPEGIADGVLLQVDGGLSKPLALTVSYAEAVARDADGLGVALQRADGSWLALPMTALDKATRTLTVALDGRLHSGAPASAPASIPAPTSAPAALATASSLSSSAASVTLDFRVVLYRDFCLSPRQATLKLGESQVFVPYAYTRGVIGTVCVADDVYGCIPMPLIGATTVPFENSKPGYSRRWYVFAQEGGEAASGTVTPRATLGATYRAPARVPDVNPVLVSFVSTNQQTGRTVTVTASVTVKEPVWTGIARGTLSAAGGGLAFSLPIQAVWAPDPQGNDSRFTANGTQGLGVIEITCTGSVSPSSAVLPPGALVIDRIVNPPRYTLDVGSVWRNTLTGSCPGQGSGSVAFDVPGRLLVEGTVDGNGSSITGNAVVNDIAWDWALGSQL